MNTLKDVAQLAGVSTWMVSKVLSGGAKKVSISAASKQRVLDAAKKLRYSPNRQARMLRKGKSQVIGILMGKPEYQDEYWNSFSGIMVASMDQGIRAHSYDTLMIGASGKENLSEVILQYFNEKRIDGLLIPEHSCPDPVLPSLLNTSGPVVLAGGYRPNLLPRVYLDDGAGIRAAVKHVAASGHRQILWLSFNTSKTSHPSLVHRRDAFWSEIRAANLTGDELLFEPPLATCAHLSTEAIRQTRTVCLAAWKKIMLSTAVICYNERIALGLYAAANESGVRIPNQLSVIGFDDLIANMAWPPMTTVSHRQDEIGRQSAALVCELSSNSFRKPEMSAPCVRVDASLVIRESTASPGR